MPFYRWSETAASNASADPTINYSEGQAPSSINDSARSLMAALRMWGTDISGSIVTSGTSTAYALSSHSVFDSLAHMDGQAIAFTPHTTNGATVTLNVDGLGAKPLRAQPSVDLQSGILIQGTPYAALYNNSDAAFYLFGVGANPGVPLGTILPFAGSTAPSSSFVLAYGQAVSRSAYSNCFSLFGTSYGSGDGTTTFNLPDLRGRFLAGADNMGGSAASRLTSTYLGAAATLGNGGGSQSHTLTANEIPTITSSVSTSGTLTGATSVFNTSSSNSTTGGGGFTCGGAVGAIQPSVSVSGSMSGSATSNNTGGAAHSIVPPTLIINYLIRII